jgi:RNA polymerase sigma factor (sigma-70 family)
MDDKNTRKLIKLYRRTKSQKALSVLMINYDRALKKACQRKSIIEFDERYSIAQDFLLEAIKKEFDMRRKNKFLTYLLRFIPLRIIDEERKRYRRIELPSADPGDPGDGIEQIELNEALISAIKKLPHDQKVISGCLFYGMSQADIVNQTGYSPAHISKIFKTAKEKLKKGLIEHK